MTGHTCLLWLGLVSCSLSPWPGVSGRNVTGRLTVGNGGTWGDWHSEDFCPDGAYAVGYQMKIEEKLGAGDDTSMNGVRLRCEHLAGGAFGGDVTSGVSKWGDWGSMARCSPNQFLTAFSLQVEGKTGAGDDTAANFVTFRCREYDVHYSEYELAVSPGRGWFGDFGSWSRSCPMGSAICGSKTRVEEPQGGGDDTAMNDMIVLCCSEPPGVIL